MVAIPRVDLGGGQTALEDSPPWARLLLCQRLEPRGESLASLASDEGGSEGEVSAEEADEEAPQEERLLDAARGVEVCSHLWKVRAHRTRPERGLALCSHLYSRLAPLLTSSPSPHALTGVGG